MTLEIESHFGGCVLSGPELSREELEARLTRAQQECGGSREGFAAALGCSGRRIAEPCARPRYRYDLDIGALFDVKH